jgi:hypothetical protein
MGPATFALYSSLLCMVQVSAAPFATAQQLLQHLEVAAEAAEQVMSLDTIRKEVLQELHERGLWPFVVWTLLLPSLPCTSLRTGAASCDAQLVFTFFGHNWSIVGFENACCIDVSPSLHGST